MKDTVIGGWVLRARSLSVVLVYYLAIPFWEHLCISVRHSCIATFDARGHLAWTLLGVIIVFLRSLYSKFTSYIIYYWSLSSFFDHYVRCSMFSSVQFL